MNHLTIAIDGPASSGKSTVAKLVGQKLGLIYIDTGAMYRVIAFEALQQDISIHNEQGVVELAKNTHITFESKQDEQLVFSNGKDVTAMIRKPDVTNAVSQIASYPEVREELVKQQRNMSGNIGVVMDGRDIGTVVLPQADVKIFLVASVEARASRRYKENLENGIVTPLETLTEEIESRDYKDMHRESSPLVQAEDAILVDTTTLTIDEVVERILQIAQQKKRM